jgi:hypothetical protein
VIKWSGVASPQITGFNVYFVENSDGLHRSVFGSLSTTTVGLDGNLMFNETLDLRVKVGTLRQNFTHIAVYTKSNLVEQTTPQYIPLLDHEAMVSNMAFVGKDLDKGQLGGNLTWDPPSDSSRTTHYNVYFAIDSMGTNRTLRETISVGTNEHVISRETLVGPYTHFIVHTVGKEEESVTFTSLEIMDTDSSVSHVSFVDLDIDPGEIRGTVQWIAPVEIDHVTSYNVYFAEGSTGYKRVHRETVLAGTNKIEIPADTTKASYTHFLVYTVSTLMEQTTPRSVAISDTDGRIANVTFTDVDLDNDQLGGLVQWNEAHESALVDFYKVYLADDVGGINKTLLCPVPGSDNPKYVMPYNSNSGYNSNAHMRLLHGLQHEHEVNGSNAFKVNDTNGTNSNFTNGGTYHCGPKACSRSSSPNACSPSAEPCLLSFP